jgi:hypothetical protein
LNHFTVPLSVSLMLKPRLKLTLYPDDADPGPSRTA